MGKQYRPQPSRIDLLPDELREELEARLSDRSQSQQSILAWLRAPLEVIGEAPISQSGLSRFSKRISVEAQEVRKAAEAAAAVVREAGDDVPAASRAILHARIYEHSKQPQDVSTILKLGRAVRDIEEAAKKASERAALEAARSRSGKDAGAAEAPARRRDPSPEGIAALKDAVAGDDAGGAAEGAAGGAAGGAAA